MTPAGRDALRELIEETRRWLGYHKSRREKGRIEALACHIRLKSLRDAWAAMEKADGQGSAV